MNTPGQETVLDTLLAGFAAGGERPLLLAVRGPEPDGWSAARLHDAILRFAQLLADSGMGEGGAVAIVAPPGPEWVAAYFGILSAGAVAVPLDHGLDDSELGRFLEAAGCGAVITPDSRMERLRSAGIGLPLVPLREPGNGHRGGRRQRFHGAPAAPASLLLTSGTTGTPKVVPLTHGQLTHNVHALVAAGVIRKDERVLLPLPLHHVYPFTVGLLATLASGGTVIFPEGMSGPQILEAMQRTRPQLMVGVPRLYETLVTGIEARIAARGRLARSLYRLLLRCSIALRRHAGLRVGRLLFRPLHGHTGSCLRILGCGGARLEEDTWWRLEGLGWEVLTGYGLTETAPVVAFNPRGRARIGTEGIALPGVEIRIQARPDTGQGEIQVRGPNVFSGYRDDPERTRAAFTEDGWFRTGDLGSLDGDGYLRVAGRADELIVLPDGKKVFPERLERVYGESPYIRDIAILPEQGRLMALVVPHTEALRARGTARLATVINEDVEMRGRRLARYERVSGCVFTGESLPRTRLGKLRRHLLPGIYAAAQRGAAPAPERTVEPPPGLTAVQEHVWRWLSERYPDRNITPQSSLQLDLGVDSLDWVNMSLEWQQAFNLRLTEEALSGIITVSDLLEAVASAANMAPEASAAAARSAQGRLQARGPLLEALGRVLFFMNGLLMRALFRVRGRGLDRLPAQGPLLITPNHASYLDPFVLAAVLPWSTVRATWWAAWSGILFTGPVTRGLSRLIQAFPVDPDRSPAAGLMLARELLAQGRIVVWFPEGRRSPGGELLPLQAGVGVLLAESEATVLPVAIRGAFEALPRGHVRPRLVPVTVTFGEPCPVSELESGGEGSSTGARITSALQARMAGVGVSTS